MRRTRQDLGFVALKVEGGILPAEFLQKVVALEAKGQLAKDYKLPKGTTIKDEIGRAWRIACAEWREFRENSQREDVDRTKLGVDQWLLTLFKVVLGHEDIAPCSLFHVGDRAFPITHKSINGVVPLVLTTEGFRLDKTDVRFGEEGRRRSPHALMQEFLNAREECLWGMISNGRVVQLLRDNPSLSKPAYIEADLERIFEEQLYSDFAAMWLMFHGSRFACNDGKPTECLMEEWRKEGHETGERALADLRKGVTTALKELGTGFLQPNQNVYLKEALKTGGLTPEAYFRELLRLVYRLLFLLCVEDRNLLHAGDTSEEAQLLYSAGYSINRLRHSALLKRNYNGYCDLWEGLAITFQGLCRGEMRLGLPALGGLFADGHCPYIEQSVIENQFLLRAIYALSFFRTGEVLARVNYRDMGTEELGSVYESLLELHPSVDVASAPWKFEFIGDGNNGSTGSERKLSGSYYTPTSLVNELLRSTVDPVIEDVKLRNPENPRKAMLELKIIDPACGSGHFLLAAARRLALEISKLDMTSDVSEEAARRHALREVVRSCIYGVDKNELALELCKTALWIEAVEPGRPLNFLDAHLRCGDSLVGILNTDVIDKGIPDEAYAVLTGDDKASVNELKKNNKGDKYEHAVVQGSVFDQKSMTMLAETREAVDDMPEDTIEQIEAKQEAFQTWLTNLDQSPEEVKANLFVGAFFTAKTKDNIALVPRTEDLTRLKRHMAPRSQIVESCHVLAQKHKFFHWPLAFSEVFSRGGFDVVIGNPPWEVSELSEEEYFAVRAPSVAGLAGAKRKKAIADLKVENPSLFKQYEIDKRGYEAGNSFCRGSGRYLLTAVGKLNSYALFCETFLRLLSDHGRAGLIVPTGIAFDDTNKAFFSETVTKRRLVSLFDFENKERLFRSVHQQQKFCLLVLGSNVEAIKFTFFATNVEQLSDTRRLFEFSPAEMELVNPNTKTSPICRTQHDAELLKKIYKNVPVFVDERDAEKGNPWRVTFRQGLFNMTSDSNLFKTFGELSAEGAILNGVNWQDKSGKLWVPLYEGKMVHLYDHRWLTHEPDGSSRDVSLNEKCDTEFRSLPRYWVAEEIVLEKLQERGWKHNWLLGWRKITNPSNARTMIVSVFPKAGAGDNLLLMFPGLQEDRRLLAALIGNLSSIIFDCAVRFKVGSWNLNFFTIKQLPVIPPEAYSEEDLTYISRRVSELVYTSEDMKAFAESQSMCEPSFLWNEQRRAILKAELDAYYARLYGLTKAELAYLLDPSEVHGPDFPSETFRVLKEAEIQEFGEFRSRRLIFEAFERLQDQKSFGVNDRVPMR